MITIEGNVYIDKTDVMVSAFGFEPDAPGHMVEIEALQWAKQRIDERIEELKERFCGKDEGNAQDLH